MKIRLLEVCRFAKAKQRTDTDGVRGRADFGTNAIIADAVSLDGM